MNKNGKEMSKKIEHGYGKNINGTLYQVMEEINENEKRNDEWKGRMEQPKMTISQSKTKRMNVKTLVETVDRMKKMQEHNHYWKKEGKRQTSTKYKKNE